MADDRARAPGPAGQQFLDPEIIFRRTYTEGDAVDIDVIFHDLIFPAFGAALELSPAGSGLSLVIEPSPEGSFFAQVLHLRGTAGTPGTYTFEWWSGTSTSTQFYGGVVTIEEAAVVGPPVDPPGVPTPKIAGISSTGAIVSVVRGPGGTPAAYSIFIGATPPAASELGTTFNGGGVHVLSGLTPSTEYTVYVRAATRGVRSAWSAGQTFITPATDVVPGRIHPPTGLAVTPGATTATASWTRATTGEVVGNASEYRLGTSGPWTSTGAETAATLTGLTVDTAYTLQVRDLRGTDGSPPAVSVFRTLPAPPVLPAAPGPPTLVSVVPGDGRLTARWTPPASAGASPITRYEVLAAAGGWTDAGIGSSFTIGGLVNGTAYPVVVRAVSSSGRGAASNAITGTPAAPAPIPPPDRPRGAGNATGITWTAAVTGFDAGAITAWPWRLRDSAGAVVASGTVNRGDLAFLADGSLSLLTNAPTGAGPWTFATRITTADGTGPWSAPSNPRRVGLATAGGKPPPPVVAPGNQILRVHFTPPLDDGNADRTGIEYQIRTAAGGRGEDDPPPGPSGQQAGPVLGPFALGGDGVEYTLRERDPTPPAAQRVRLANGQAFEVRHRGRNSAGATAWSDWSAGVEPALQTPSAPLNPRLENGPDGTLVATWEPPAADGGAPVTGYQIRLRIDGVEGDWTDLPGWNTTTKRIGRRGSLFDADPDPDPAE